MSAIIHDGVKPTLQELEKFEATPEEVEIEGRGKVNPLILFCNWNPVVLWFNILLRCFISMLERPECVGLSMSYLTE